jgi:oxygen-independent coproporphyrinogen-3 oxidase
MRDVDAYIDALIAEINAFETEVNVGSVFIGGGTPSCIEPHYIRRIAEAIYSRFKVAEDAEFTIEANPCTLALISLRHTVATVLTGCLSVFRLGRIIC